MSRTAEESGKSVDQWLNELIVKQTRGEERAAIGDAPARPFGPRGGEEPLRLKQAPRPPGPQASAPRDIRKANAARSPVEGIRELLGRISTRIDNLQAEQGEVPASGRSDRHGENEWSGRAYGNEARTPVREGRGERRTLDERLPDPVPTMDQAMRNELQRLRTAIERRAEEDNALLREEIRTIRSALSERRAGGDTRFLERAQEDMLRRLDMIRQTLEQPRDLGDLNGRLSEIRRLVSAIPTERDLNGITTRLDTLADHLDRLDALEGQLARIEKISGGLETLPDLARTLSTLGEITRQLDQLPRMTAELDRRIDMLPRLAEDLAQVRRSVADGRRDDARVMEGLMVRLDDISSRLDQPGFARSQGEFDALESRLSDVAARLEDVGGIDPRTVRDMELHFSTLAREIMDRLSDMEDGSGQAVAGQISELERRLAFRSDRNAEFYEDQIADLARRIDRAGGSELADQIAAGIERLEEHLIRGRDTEKLADIEGRLTELADQVDRISGISREDAARLVGDVARLRHSVDNLLGPAVNGMEAELHALVRKVDKLAASDIDPLVLGRIESRLTDLADRMDERPADRLWLQDAFGRLEAQISAPLFQNNKDAHQFARSVALEAIEAMGNRSQGGQAGELESVLKAMEDLRSDISHASERDRASLERIGDLLGRLSERTGTTSVAAFRGPQPSPVRQQVFAEVPPPSAPSGVATGKAAVHPVMDLPQEPFPARREERSQAAQAPNTPTPSGRNQPVPSRADQSAPAPTATAEPLPAQMAPAVRPDLRADFIAAARRAARSHPPDEPASAKVADKAESGRATLSGPKREEQAPSAGAARMTAMRRRFLVSAGFVVLAVGVARCIVPMELPPIFPASVPPEPVQTRKAAPEARDGQAEPPAALPAAPSSATSSGEAPAQSQTQSRSAAPASAPSVIAPSALATAALAPEAPLPKVDAIADGKTGAASSLPAGDDQSLLVRTPPLDTAAPAGRGAGPGAIPVATPAANGAANALTTAGLGAATPTSFVPAPGRDLPDVLPASPDRTAAMPAPALPAASPDPLADIPATVGNPALRTAVMSGNGRAMFELGALFAEGRGIARAIDRSLYWYRRAAELDFAPAQYRLGSLYEKGQYVPRDLAQAMRYYSQAADAGNVNAMHNLAVIYVQGINGSPDYAKAAGWFTKAAEFGVRDSQFNLGILYARGLGLELDLTNSYKWFDVAARAGDLEAARKRDDVARALDRGALARARLASDTWHPETPDPSANDTRPDPAWVGDPEQVTGSTSASSPVKTTNPLMYVQTRLGLLGYDIGMADGLMGDKTRTAIMAYQRSRGLPATGQVDQKLMDALVPKG